MQIENLQTEQVNPRTTNIDSVSVLDGLKLINNEDKTVAFAIEEQLESIAQVANDMIETLKYGGRIFYVGAGTSGRLGVLDAAECPPTYGIDEGIIIPLIAGGQEAMLRAIEGAEDDLQLAAKMLEPFNLTKSDMIIGIAASGRTPFVIGGLLRGQELGCKTASISALTNSEISKNANHCIEIDVGPEPITGSTRMKAGTAQKLVLNMLSTITMVNMGKVYNNEMIELQATNKKLVRRSQIILKRLLDVDDNEVLTLLKESDHNLKIAIVMYKMGVTTNDAKELIACSNGKIKDIPGFNA